MIHLAPVVTAVAFGSWFVLMLISLLFRGTGRTPGCGCLGAVALAAIVATILAFRF